MAPQQSPRSLHPKDSLDLLVDRARAQNVIEITLPDIEYLNPPQLAGVRQTYIALHFAINNKPTLKGNAMELRGSPVTSMHLINSH
jgi:hypothetical protein